MSPNGTGTVPELVKSAWGKGSCSSSTVRDRPARSPPPPERSSPGGGLPRRPVAGAAASAPGCGSACGIAGGIRLRRGPSTRAAAPGMERPRGPARRWSYNHSARSRYIPRTANRGEWISRRGRPSVVTPSRSLHCVAVSEVGCRSAWAGLIWQYFPPNCARSVRWRTTWSGSYQLAKKTCGSACEDTSRKSR